MLLKINIINVERFLVINMIVEKFVCCFGVIVDLLYSYFDIFFYFLRKI